MRMRYSCLKSDNNWMIWTGPEVTVYLVPDGEVCRWGGVNFNHKSPRVRNPSATTTDANAALTLGHHRVNHPHRNMLRQK